MTTWQFTDAEAVNKAMITADTVVLGFFVVVLGLIFFEIRYLWKKFYTMCRTAALLFQSGLRIPRRHNGEASNFTQWSVIISCRWPLSCVSGLRLSAF